MKKIELLAPAGNRACLSAALAAGADAVYFGVQSFNMRAAADNFNVGDLDFIVGRCAEFGAHAYLTLNTIVYTGEIQALREIVRTAQTAGVAAVIAWDPAVLEACREQGMGVHLSTQASVANAAAAEFYKNLGVNRIVPARECTLEEIKTIRDRVDVELETFVHGAMCVSVSGRCFLSQLTTGRSANRGGCVQNCRRFYHVIDEDGETELEMHSGHLLSARDMCALPFLDKLAAAGVDAFKIEGRNKGPDYVATTTSCYRRAIDALYEGRFDSVLTNELTRELATVFNRGFSSGFYFNRPIAEFSVNPGNQARFSKHFVGRATNYYAHPQVVEIEVLDTPLKVGDQVRIQGDATGDVKLEVTQLRIDGGAAESAPTGAQLVTFPCAAKVRRNDRVFVLKGT